MNVARLLYYPLVFSIKNSYTIEYSQLMLE